MDSEPQYVPYPLDPWNEIVPGLFQGGQVTAPRYWRDESFVKVGSEFDAVYSFYWGGMKQEKYGPDPQVQHSYFQMPDGPLSERSLSTVGALASEIARQLEAGEQVLVRCQAGYNRSGLVVAFVLMDLGHSAESAINLIREKRSRFALHNPHFLRYIREAGGSHATTE